MKTVSLISVPVTDPQKAKEFYLKMGLNLVREMPLDKDKLWIQMGFPEGNLNITLVTWFPKMPPGSLQAVILDCDNIVSEIDRLKNNGIVAGKIDDTPWGKFAAITDPDGNTWSLHESSNKK
jgi:predicted enzyme related to lactoylglutathione lyase